MTSVVAHTRTHCSSGCGFTSEDPKALKRCSRCKVAQYCCVEHQKEHWKAGHKHECFPVMLNLTQIQISVMASMHDPNAPSIKVALAAAKDNLQGTGGVSLFLGTSPERELKFFTDQYLIQDECDDDNNDDFPTDLVLPHVPTLLVQKAEDEWKDNPTLQRQITDRSTQIICEQFRDDDPSTVLGGVPFTLYNSFVGSNLFRAAVKNCFFESRRYEAVDFLRRALPKVDPTLQHSIPDPILRAQAQSLVGRNLNLEGGIDMVYITEPVICFADLSPSELNWFHVEKKGFSSVIVKAPIVAYRSVEEGWLIARWNTRSHSPFSLYPSIYFSSDEIDAIFLKMFVAAAEFGDVAAIYGAWNPAKTCAMARRQEDVFVQAAKKLLNMLLKIHPQPRREEALFLHKIGLLHDSRASWLLREGKDEEARDELISAARCYHSAAMRTHQYYPNHRDRYHHYNALGTTFLRLEAHEMVKRAYIWALTDPHAWADVQIIGRKMEACWDMMKMDPAQCKKENKKALMSQRSTTKKSDASLCYSIFHCTYCMKVLRVTPGKKDMFCARCQRMRYCSTECLTSDWPRHKKECKTADDDLTKGALSTRFQYGTITDLTREVLGPAKLGDLQLKISLEEAAKRVYQWKTQNMVSKSGKTELRLDIPTPEWLIEEIKSRNAP